MIFRSLIIWSIFVQEYLTCNYDKPSAMNDLYIKGTDDTPEIKLLSEENKISISGMSLPEDVKAFYKPVLNWMEEYFGGENRDTAVTFNMTYFNTASSKMILDMLYIFKKAINNGFHINVIWSYDEEDEEMLETGQDYADIVGIPISFKQISFFNA